MNPGDFLLISAVALGVLLTLGLMAWRPEKQAKEPPHELTRWRRFRIHFGAVRDRIGVPLLLVEEEPAGLKLMVPSRTNEGQHRLVVLGSGGRNAIEIVRGFLLWRNRFRILLAGRPWATAMAGRAGQSPLLLQFIAPLEPYELAGNLARREYEIRKQMKLVASISWQRPPGDGDSRKDYVLEALKSEDPLPLLALALLVELAVAQEGQLTPMPH